MNHPAEVPLTFAQAAQLPTRLGVGGVATDEGRIAQNLEKRVEIKRAKSTSLNNQRGGARR
jgi:hypothetical protein